MLQLQAIGHIGKDATINEVNGKKVINFSIAHSEKYKNKEGVPVEKTIWVECSMWGESTAVAPWLKKGVQVYVQGMPEVSAYENKERKPAASLRCRVLHLQLLGGGNKETTGTENSASANAATATAAQPADHSFTGGLPDGVDIF